MIAALQVSLDSFTVGPNGEQDWVESWADAKQLIPDVDLFLLGGRMYPDYGEYWRTIHDHPDRVAPFTEKVPTEREIAYARHAAATPHVVLSTTLDSVAWPPSARIVRDIAAIRTLKGEPGKNTYVVGGPTFVASLLKANLLDELKLIVHPVILSGDKPLFGGIPRRSLNFVQAQPAESGRIILTYTT